MDGFKVLCGKKQGEEEQFIMVGKSSKGKKMKNRD